jgi:glycosyltransferase involved in cell wall biosynthesis
VGVSVAGRANQEPLVSVVMPCLNEEKAIGSCIQTIPRTFAGAEFDVEIVVCDIGPTYA